MGTEIEKLLAEKEQLIRENSKLHAKLSEAGEIIEGIRKGKIDAVIITNNGVSDILVSKTADHAYRRFIENMSEGVVTLLPDGTILYSNSSFSDIIGVPLANIIGKDMRTFVPLESLHVLDNLIIGNSTGKEKFEVSFSDRKGMMRHFIVSSNSVPLQDYMALNLVWTDVTEQKESEEKLMVLNLNLNKAIKELLLSEARVNVLNEMLNENIRTLQEMNSELSTFAHIASHDLQEPLRKILTYCSILKTEYYDIIDQQGKDYLSTMLNASARMRNLINDILKYSELSNSDMQFSPSDLQFVINEVLMDLEIVVNETKATITIDRKLPAIEANSSQMRQLFQNLISNSLKFIKPGIAPRIDIRYEIKKGREFSSSIDESRADDDFCMLCIKDNGIGFDPQYSSKMFTIFQRLSSGAYPGTGIGLAICKKIVEKHNGWITAEGAVNEGVLITVLLPVVQTNKESSISTISRSKIISG